MRRLKQSTAANVMVFMTASSDHVTGLAAATLTITASKDGAAFAGIAPTVTDRGSGWYKVELTAPHTDTLGDLVLHITATSADPTDTIMQVVDDAATLLAGIYESTLTVKDFLRLGGAVLYGKATGLEGAAHTFRDYADSKDRVVATYAAGARTPTTRDAT